MEVTRPQFEHAFQGMLDFAAECSREDLDVRFTVVDVLPEEEIEASRKLADSWGSDSEYGILRENFGFVEMNLN